MKQIVILLTAAVMLFGASQVLAGQEQRLLKEVLVCENLTRTTYYPGGIDGPDVTVVRYTVGETVIATDYYPTVGDFYSLQLTISFSKRLETLFYLDYAEWQSVMGKLLQLHSAPSLEEIEQCVSTVPLS